MCFDPAVRLVGKQKDLGSIPSSALLSQFKSSGLFMDNKNYLCDFALTMNEFFVVVAFPSTVPTSEALLPRRSSRHPPPPATPRVHSASRPRPQRSTGSDVRSLVVDAIQRKHCTAAESLRWCSVVPVLIQHTQDTTYCAPY